MIPQEPYIEVTRSFSFRLNTGNYQGADFFSSRKMQCARAEEELVSQELYAMCVRDVERDIEEYRAGRTPPEEHADKSHAAFQGQARKNGESLQGLHPPPPASAAAGNPFTVKTDSSDQNATLKGHVLHLAEHHNMDRAEAHKRFKEFLAGVMGWSECPKVPDPGYEAVLPRLPALVELYGGKILDNPRKFGTEVREGWRKLNEFVAKWPPELQKPAVAAAEAQYPDCAADIIEFMPAKVKQPDMLAFLKACRLSKECAAALRDCGVPMRDVQIDWEHVSVEEALKQIPKGKTKAEAK